MIPEARVPMLSNLKPNIDKYSRQKAVGGRHWDERLRERIICLWDNQVSSILKKLFNRIKRFLPCKYYVTFSYYHLRLVLIGTRGLRIKKKTHNDISLRWAGHQTLKNQSKNIDIFTLQMLCEYVDSTCTAVLYHLYVDLSTCLFVRYIITKQSPK